LGEFEVYTNTAESTSGDAGASLTEKFRVAHDGTSTFTNNVVIGGNLTVNGTQTTLNTATLQVEDKNIVLNYGTGDTSGSADGAGITIQDAVSGSSDAAMTWNASSDFFNFSHKINIQGDLQAYNVYAQDYHVLNTAGTGWHEWATRSDDRVNLSVHDISANGALNVSSGGSTSTLTLGTYSTTDQGFLYLTGSTANKQSVLRTTNGNLHLDSNAGNATYINYYSGSGTYFGTGAGGVAAVMGPDGDLWKGSADNTGNRYFHDGYHPNADKWTTARSHTVTLTGEVTGTATQSVDGTGNKTWSIGTTLNHNSLNDQYVQVLPRHNADGDSLVVQSKASITIWDVSGASDAPSSASDGLVLSAGWDSSSWGIQQYHDFHTNDLYLRAKNNGSMTSWERVFHDTYHPNADKWTTARTLTLSGDLNGSVSFDGSSNFTLSAQVVDDSHNHVISNVDGLQSALDGKLDTSFDHAQSHKTWTGINAANTQAKRYHIARLYGCPAHWDSNWQNIEFTVTAESYESGYLKFRLMGDYGGAGSQANMIKVSLSEAHGTMISNFQFVLGSPVDAGWDHSGQDTFYVDLFAEAAHYSQWQINAKNYGHGYQTSHPSSGGATTVFYTSPSTTNTSNFTVSHNNTYIRGHKIWNELNDGTGSGLDADLLDGQHASAFLTSHQDISGKVNKSGDTMTGNLTIGTATDSTKLVFPDKNVPESPTATSHDRQLISMGNSGYGGLFQTTGRGGLMLASADDSLILASGDIGRNYDPDAGTWNPDADSEDIYLVTDGSIRFRTNLQTTSAYKEMSFDANGDLTVSRNITASGTITSTGNMQHTGLTMTSGTDIDQLYTVTDSLTLTTSYQDTSINGGELSTGTYIIQLYVVGDHSVGGSHYNEFYSGVISWYGSATNSAEVDEIVLHRAGHAPNASVIHLRTQRHTAGGDNLVLQIKGNYNMTAARNYVFKFRRMI